MKIKVQRKQLLAGLQSVSGVISSRSTLPVLSHVLLAAAGGQLRLSATDLDRFSACSIDAATEADGSLTLPMQKLLPIVKESAADEIELSADAKSQCKIVAGRSKFTINGMPSEEFPMMPKPGGNSFTVQGSTLGTLLRRTAFAVSDDQTRYVLNGVLLKSGSGTLRAVATDGRRLAVASADVDGLPDFDLLVPTGALADLVRLAAAANVVVSFDASMASFEFGSSRFVTKLIEGNYPNWQQVIPATNNYVVPFNREELSGVLKRARIMTSEKANSVKFRFNDNRLTLSALTPEIGDASDEMDVKFPSGELSIALNPDYVGEALGVMEQADLNIELLDDLSPAVFRGDGFLYVVMPMRIS